MLAHPLPVLAPLKRTYRRRVYPHIENPWGLTPSECRVLELLITLGSNKAIANEMGVALKTAETHIFKAEAKIGTHRVGAAVAWDRLRRGNG